MNENESTKSHESDSKSETSLDLFHSAQQMAMDNNYVTAIAKLEESLAATEAEKEPAAEWIAYIKGTLSYMRKDLSGVREQISIAGDNALVLSRLEKGLERRGTCDYKEDYVA